MAAPICSQALAATFTTSERISSSCSWNVRRVSGTGASAFESIVTSLPPAASPGGAAAVLFTARSPPGHRHLTIAPGTVPTMAIQSVAGTGTERNAGAALRLLERSIVATAPGERMPTPTISVNMTQADRPVQPEPSPDEIVFEVRDVSVLYGGAVAVEGVSMDVSRYRITALIGPSGCGKSTLLRSFNRMNDLIVGASVQGRIAYHGQDLYALERGSGRGAAPDRDGVPEAQPVPEVDLRQRRVRTAHLRPAQGPRRHGRERARARRAVGRGQGQVEEAGVRAVRRSTAAACASRAASRSSPK